MSDQPLFQNSDEQEAAYAPQQLPHGAAGDEGTEDDAGTVGGAALPAAATGGAVNTAGMGYAGGTAGTTAGMVPAVGATALAAQTEEQDETERRD